MMKLFLIDCIFSSYGLGLLMLVGEVPMEFDLVKLKVKTSILRKIPNETRVVAFCLEDIAQVPRFHLNI